MQTKYLVLVVLAFIAIAPAHAADKQPNIVFVLMDNLGYGELGCYGGGILRGAATPRIEPDSFRGLREYHPLMTRLGYPGYSYVC